MTEFLGNAIDFVLHIDTHLNGIIAAYGTWTYLILFLIIFCETGLVVTPFSARRFAAFRGGAFAARGSLDPFAWSYCCLPVRRFWGTTVNYWIGRLIGPKVFERDTRFINRKHLERTQGFYEKHGGKTIVLARFMPIIRTFAPFVAGIGRMDYKPFLMFNVSGGILWIGLFDAWQATSSAICRPSRRTSRSWFTRSSRFPSMPAVIEGVRAGGPAPSSRPDARAALLFALLAAAQVSAQQADSARAQDTLRFRLRPVEVSVLRGSTSELRTPAAITAVGKSAIQDAQLTVGIDEALAVVPGVVVNNRYNFSLGSRIAVRGLGARAAFGVRGVRLIVDGIPLTMPDGQANVNNLDLGSAGRIEVLRGPASSLYGNAAGGVVALETEAAPQTRFAAQLRTVAGDVGRDGLDRMMKNQVKVGGQQGRADYLLSFARLESDGFRDHSATKQSQVNARVGIQQSERTRWTVLFNYADSPLGAKTRAHCRSIPRTPSRAWPGRAIQRPAPVRSRPRGRAVSPSNTTRGASHFRVSAYGLTRSLRNPLPFAYILLDRSGGGLRAQYSRDQQRVRPRGAAHAGQ